MCTVLHTKTHQKEWCYVLDPICEPLRIPNLTVIQQQPVDHLYGRHQAEVGVQDGQVEDEDVGGGGITFLGGDLPYDQDVTGCPHCQVEHLDPIVEKEAVRGHGAYCKLVPWWRSTGVTRGGGVHVEVGGGVQSGVEHCGEEVLMLEGEAGML